MTTVVPYWLPEAIWTVIRAGDKTEDIYVRVGADDWLEVKTGIHCSNDWLFDFVNGEEIDHGRSYPWVNRRGYTVLIPEEL